MTFERILVVNRGEPALRLVHAVGEYNREHGTELRTIALVTEPDRGALFARRADESHDFGPASVPGPDGRPMVSYVDLQRLEDALVATRADAVWTGWGFVSERAEFVELCDELGVTFIGPSADVMRRLGDKIASKALAEAAGVPVAPWSGGPVATVDEAVAHAERIGYPLMVKATAGGGGRGIRRVDHPDQLAAAFASARAEAAGAVGDDTVFLERLIEHARHIEVQILGDSTGTVWPVGLRDCSVQRRNQKVLEEAPSPVLDAAAEREVLDAAARLGASAGYVNAGTVEFLYEPDAGRFSFMEVNARLQVEHPVTELTTGFDLVKAQLHVALGRPLEGDPPVTVGWAIEARLNAEDPDRGFAPSSGVIDLLRLPSGPGIRVDTGVEEGDSVVPDYDSMIAKIIATGRTRDEARARLRQAVDQTTVVIRDGATNKALLQRLLAHPDLARGEVDVGWVESVALARPHEGHGADVALVAAAIDAYDQAAAVALARFRASALRGRPEVDEGNSRRVALRSRGSVYECSVACLGPNDYLVEVDGSSIGVHRERFGLVGSRLEIAGRTWRVVSAAHGMTHLVEVDGHPHLILHDEGGIVRSPAPAVVVAIEVEVGDEVVAGDRLAVIEAMKTETVVTAEFGGVVREVAVRTNVQVGAGDPLVVVEPSTSAPAEASDSGRLDLSALVGDGEVGHDRCRHWLGAVRQLLLGYDLDAAAIEAMARHRGTVCPDALDGAEQARLEDEVLAVFADVVALSGHDPGDLADARRGAEGYLFDLLRTLESRGKGLPASFLEQLGAALAHYGIDDLDPGPELEAALYRLVRSQHRMSRQITPVLRVLESRLEQPAPGAHLRALLDRVLAESRTRYPAVHDLARELHMQAYDLPFLTAVRERTLAEASEALDRLAATPVGAERARLVASLVECPQPLRTLLSRRYGRASAGAQQGYLEVMARRYYRIRHLDDLRTERLDGRCILRAAYDHEGARVEVVATHVDRAGLADAVDSLVPVVEAVPEEHDVVVDLYVWDDDLDEDVGRTRDEVVELVSSRLGRQQLRRVVVAISAPDRGPGMAGVVNFTLRPDAAGGYAEETLYRDLHPMMAKRLDLWRFEAFELERLPSLEDLYCFCGRARTNPRDERIFAVAEVRDLTPVTDDEGRVQRLPELERVFREIERTIRHFQARRPSEQRLLWNRVLLYVWPVVELEADEVDRVVARLLPETEGLGLQKVQIVAPVRSRDGGEVRRRVFELPLVEGADRRIRVRDLSDRPVRPLTDYEQQVVRLRRRGLAHPYEIVRSMTPDTAVPGSGIPRGAFAEYDLDGGRLVPVDRPWGRNSANVVCGVVTSFTERHPEGMRRVILLGDPSRGMGSLSEPECARIMAAFDLAAELDVPLEWFAVSAGALISMDSGTENMDWIARVLRRIIEFTQAGGEVNVVVTGVNVGAQPYWNAEATMLMHTRGILIMTPDGAMVLTGKQALDYSGGVSAEDNLGIGGHERIMGPNGQSQYLAHDLADACRILLRHYDHTYVVPGERFPRRAPTSDPVERDITESPHGGEFATLGEVFSDAVNPGRKKPFEVRALMAATVDRDHPTLERWYGMRDAEIVVVWDAFLGGHPVEVIGFEAKNLPRVGFVPADGPDQWTSGTLFPHGSRKVARALNAASGNRPVVVLANLSGFDGSPESLRSLQLEYGAEIGRAVVNFRGPIVFCVVSRYHGGAFVVFSRTLNDDLEVAALEGSRASVIGGAPAAAVVFAGEVRRRVDGDPRLRELGKRLEAAGGDDRVGLVAELARLRDEVHAEVLGRVASEFDGVHSVQRARQVGSIDEIIDPVRLRPYLIDAVERGIRRELERS